MVVSNEATLCVGGGSSDDGGNMEEVVMDNCDELETRSSIAYYEEDMQMDVELLCKHQIFCSTPLTASLAKSKTYFREPTQILIPRCGPFHRHVFGSEHEEPAEPIRYPIQCLPMQVVRNIHNTLMEAVALEPKYQPALTLIMPPRSENEISGFMRNSSCQVLRFLKVWYDLPSDVLFLAINTIDRFLTRMKALPKHLSCIAVSAFHVACEELSDATGVPAPSRESVSHISQSKCKSGDVQRMEDIIRTKLELGMHVPDNATGKDRRKVMGINSNPVTPLTFLKLLYAGLVHVRDAHFPQLRLPTLVPLINQLEVVVCDTRAANYRPSELAMALLRRDLANPRGDPSAAVAARVSCLQPLMSLCKVNCDSIAKIEDMISVLLYNYDNDRGETCMARFQRQRLVWRLSNRTMRHLKITFKFRRQRKLASIKETDMDMIEEPEVEYAPVRSVFGESLDLNNSEDHSVCVDYDPNDDINAQFDANETMVGSGEPGDLEVSMESEAEANCDTFETSQNMQQGDQAVQRPPSVVSDEERMETSDAEIDDCELEEEQEERMEGDCQSNDELKENCALNETVAHSRAAAAAAGYHSDKEESYCQVAKKIKEDKGLQSPRMETSRAIVRDEVLRSRMRCTVRTSPPSKITLTPVLPRHSSAVKNLAPMLLGGNSYGHTRTRTLSVLGIESIDGEVAEQHLLPLIGVDTNVSFVSSRKNTKRKKLGQVQLTHARNDGSDTDMSSEQTSSEEEMDSDYEKEFPPLPVPRPVFTHVPSIGKKPVALKKKKKKSYAMPYIATNKVLPGQHILVN